MATESSKLSEAPVYADLRNHAKCKRADCGQTKNAHQPAAFTKGSGRLYCPENPANEFLWHRYKANRASMSFSEDEIDVHANVMSDLLKGRDVKEFVNANRETLFSALSKYKNAKARIIISKRQRAGYDRNPIQ